jgi:RimJ/RimL family protein N-acetyltransferase
MMRTLDATLCRLEPLLVEHADELFQVLSDPAIYTFENSPPVSVEALRSRYERLQTRVSPDGSEVWLNWAVRLPDGGLAGFVQATVLPDGHAWVAYELNSRHWRRGIGSRAVAALLVELRERYAVRVAMAVLKAANVPSRQLLLKLGFERAAPADEARLRDDDDEWVFTKELVRA